MTTVADIPKTGTATWHGHWVWQCPRRACRRYWSDHRGIWWLENDSDLRHSDDDQGRADEGRHDIFATLNGKIMGNRFKDAGSATNEVTVNNAMGGVKAAGSSRAVSAEPFLVPMR